MYILSMAAKRTLSTADQQRLRATLQTATLAALMDSRRWQPGDLAFQGGTSLHLAHGSARFSEDLDFMVRGGLSLAGLAAQVQRKLRLPPDIPADLGVAVTGGSDARNPHIFYVTLSGPTVLGGVKVKIELWLTDAQALKSLSLKVSTVTSSAGQAFVPTLTLEEIFADKVYALGARKRIKARDVFDLWWLADKKTPPVPLQALRTRLAIYPIQGGVQATAKAWLANAKLRLIDLNSPAAANLIAKDLKRWLPSSWPMDDAAALEMICLSISQLSAGMKAMQTVASQAKRA
jgi:predicted nucleotidyltransferase component of viral defense system